jgi:hypothetical protein
MGPPNAPHKLPAEARSRKRGRPPLAVLALGNPMAEAGQASCGC